MDRKENLHRLSIELLQGQLNILIQIYGQVVYYFEFLDSFYLNFNRVFVRKLRDQILHSRRNRLYLFQTVVLNHCGCTPRGVRGVKRPEILWEIQKYSLPGRPSSQNWVKSKKHEEMHQFSSKTGKWFLILHNFGWMVDLHTGCISF